MPKIKISFTNNNIQLNEVQRWLLSDDTEGHTSFYCNFDIIQKAWRSNRLATVSVDGAVVGFVCWDANEDLIARICIINIRHAHRRNGLGTMLLNRLFSHFVTSDICIVELSPKPVTAEPFWKRMGFNKYPSDWLGENGNDPCCLYSHYKIIVPIMPEMSNPSSRYIELINTKSWLPIPNRDLKWDLNPMDSSTPSLLPIISPANLKWVVRLVQNDEPIFEAEVRHLLSSSTPSYLIILNPNELRRKPR
jgi:hypothetical protein